MPVISMVCSTIGRPQAITRLLESLRDSDLAERIEFILIDQSDDQASARVLESFNFPGPVAITSSGRGVSAGRNAGTPLATAPIVAFPDDNCWYPPDTVRLVTDRLAAAPELSGLAGMQVTHDGDPSMLRWLPKPVLVSRSNFLRTSVSSTIFLRRSALPSLAPFDEGLGVGSSDGRGSGEESDLLLRMIAAGHRLQYFPDVHVVQDDDRTSPPPSYVAKMRSYGVGQGYLWRTHRLPVPQLLYYASRKLVGAVVRAGSGQRVRAEADLAYLRGQLAGWRGA
jgi:glycosyltransferase involved in cell wall biosynthesis